MNRLYLFVLSTILLWTCRPSDVTKQSNSLIKGLDISLYPETQRNDVNFIDASGRPIADLVEYLAQSGLDYIRLKLWVHPDGLSGSLAEVEALSDQVKRENLKLLITLHFSDSWADPGKQTIPAKWTHSDELITIDSAISYAESVIKILRPDAVQIGNEINQGLLWPVGHRENGQMLRILQECASTIRSANPNTLILLHYAGLEGALTFYEEVREIDYDVIGLSYYPYWHGSELSMLTSTISNLKLNHKKPVWIVETAYPFSLGYSDFTNNLIGLDEQLVPDFPATPEGQQACLLDIENAILAGEGDALFYWGATYVAFDGNESVNGSPWENQTLFDFNYTQLPALGVFLED